jgi:hypothetical protein
MTAPGAARRWWSVLVTPARRVWASVVTNPTATTLPVTLIPAGFIAVVMGSHASKAFDNFGGSVLVRVLGAAMLLGGATVLTGILRNDSALEPIGLTFVALGLGIYGSGAIFGLGAQGLIAGLIAIGAGVGFLIRIRRLIREAPAGE